MNNYFEVLWSGGFDSTFMLCLLAKKYDCIIQPYYLDINRHVRNYEISAIKKIYSLMLSVKDFSGIIKPVKFINENKIKVSKFIDDSFYNIRNIYPDLGFQQRIISQFSLAHKNIYFGQRCYSNHGASYSLLFKLGHMQFDLNNVGYLDKSICDDKVYRLYGNLRFPIIKYHENEILDIINLWKLDNIFKSIHFCYYPIDGKPCGMCYACRVKIHQKNLSYFDELSLKRFHIHTGLLNSNSCLNCSSYASHLFSFNNVFLSDLFMCCYSNNYKIHYLKTNCGNQKDFSDFIENQISFYKPYFDTLLFSN